MALAQSDDAQNSHQGTWVLLPLNVEEVPPEHLADGTELLDKVLARELEKRGVPFVQLSLVEGLRLDLAFSSAFEESMRATQRQFLRHRKFLKQGKGVLYRHYIIPAEEQEIVFRPVSPLDVDRDLAKHAMLLNRVGVAQRHYTSILKSLPEDPEALLGMAITLAWSEQFDAAYETVSAIPAEFPEAAEGRALVALQRYYREIQPAGDDNEANEATDESLGNDAVQTPEIDIDGLLFEAHQLLVSAVDASPTCRSCWLGIAAYHARHPDGVPTLGLEAVERTGNVGIDGILHAELLIRLDRIDEARSLCERIIATSHRPVLAKAASYLLLRITPPGEVEVL